jgi:hypothetical protein
MDEELGRKAYDGCRGRLFGVGRVPPKSLPGVWPVLSVTQENVLGWWRRDRKKEIQRKYRKRSNVKRNMALRRHSQIMEELRKEHEDFLNGKTYVTNISTPGEEADGDEGGEESLVSLL